MSSYSNSTYSSDVVEIAAAKRRFSESMVKRDNDGKFAEKAGTGVHPARKVTSFGGTQDPSAARRAKKKAGTGINPARTPSRTFNGERIGGKTQADLELDRLRSRRAATRDPQQRADIEKQMKAIREQKQRDKASVVGQRIGIPRSGANAGTRQAGKMDSQYQNRLRQMSAPELESHIAELQRQRASRDPYTKNEANHNLALARTVEAESRKSKAAQTMQERLAQADSAAVDQKKGLDALDKQAKSRFRAHLRKGKSPAEALKLAQASQAKRTGPRQETKTEPNRVTKNFTTGQGLTDAELDQEIRLTTSPERKAALEKRKGQKILPKADSAFQRPHTQSEAKASPGGLNQNGTPAQGRDKNGELRYTNGGTTLNPLFGLSPSEHKRLKDRSDHGKATKRPGKPAKMSADKIADAKSSSGVIDNTTKSLLPQDHQRKAYRRYLRKGLSQAEALERARNI